MNKKTSEKEYDFSSLRIIDEIEKDNLISDDDSRFKTIENKIQFIWDYDKELKQSDKKDARTGIISRLITDLYKNKEDVALSLIRFVIKKTKYHNIDSDTLYLNVLEHVRKNIEDYSSELFYTIINRLPDFKEDIVTKNGQTSLYTFFYNESRNYIHRTIVDNTIKASKNSYLSDTFNQNNNLTIEDRVADKESLNPEEILNDILENIDSFDLSSTEKEGLNYFIDYKLSGIKSKIDYLEHAGYTDGKKSKFYELIKTGEAACFRIISEFYI